MITYRFFCQNFWQTGGLKKKREAVRSPKSREVFNSRRENHMYGNSWLEVYVRIYVTFEFRKNLDRVIGGNFGAYTFILPLPYFLNICLPFWIFYQREWILKIKILRNFREQTRVVFEWFYPSSVSEVVLNAVAKSSCFNVRVNKRKKK